MYVCGLCKAEYARADYLIRHVRSHTRQRPFVCPLCAKGFGRQDLLKRHMNIHAANNNQNNNSDSSHRRKNTATGSYSDNRHSHRVSQACRACAEKKLKCADEKPCQRCKEKNILCDFDYGLQSLVQTVSTDFSTSHSSISCNDGPVVEVGKEANSLSSEINPVVQDEIQEPIPADMMLPIEVPSSDQPVVDRQEPIARDILGDTLNFSPMGTDIQLLENDSILEDLDFSFLYDLESSRMATPLPVVTTSLPTPPPSTLSVGAEAYKHSSALTAWNPSREDNYDREQQDLILAQNIGSSTPNAETTGRARAVPRKELFHTARDRILAMILRITSGAASSRIVASFPCLDILRDLMHHALIHMRERQINNFIHIPSLDMNKQRPELLAGIVAYGSITSPSPAVRKFGYALQEAVRLAINQLVSQFLASYTPGTRCGD